MQALSKQKIQDKMSKYNPVNYWRSKFLSNDSQTPPEVLIPLLPYLKKKWILWGCRRDSELAVKLKNNGYKIIGIDRTYEEQMAYKHYIALFMNFCVDKRSLKISEVQTLTFTADKNYLQYKSSSLYDCIIAHPPEALRYDFLMDTCNSKKTFAFLIFPETIKIIKPGDIKQKIQLMPSGWQNATWFTSGLNLPEQLNFVEYENEPKLF